MSAEIHEYRYSGPCPHFWFDGCTRPPIVEVLVFDPGDEQRPPSTMRVAYCIEHAPLAALEVG